MQGAGCGGWTTHPLPLGRSVRSVDRPPPHSSHPCHHITSTPQSVVRVLRSEDELELLLRPLDTVSVLDGGMPTVRYFFFLNMPGQPASQPAMSFPFHSPTPPRPSLIAHRSLLMQ